MTTVSEHGQLVKNRQDDDNIIIFSDSDGDIEGNQNDPVGITNEFWSQAGEPKLNNNKLSWILTFIDFRKN